MFQWCFGFFFLSLSILLFVYHKTLGPWYWCILRWLHSKVKSRSFPTKHYVFFGIIFWPHWHKLVKANLQLFFPLLKTLPRINCLLFFQRLLLSRLWISDKLKWSMIFCAPKWKLPHLKEHNWLKLLDCYRLEVWWLHDIHGKSIKEIQVWFDWGIHLNLWWLWWFQRGSQS